MKFITFTKEILNEEHTQVLRALGREIGVKSPTSKTNGVIIEQILAIQNGELQPVQQTNKGAPVKMNVDLSKFYLRNNGNVYYPTVNIGPCVLSDSSIGQFVTDGVLEINQDGTGVFHVSNYDYDKLDVFVPSELIVKFGLREGDVLNAAVKPVQANQPPVMQEVFEINGVACENVTSRPLFEKISICNPIEKFDITKSNDLSLRAVDLLAPIGKGQRCLIIAPPKTGATTLINKISNAITLADKETTVLTLLVDYRLEEISDMKRGVVGEVVATSFEESYLDHIKVANYCLNRAKRIAENGKNCVVMVDCLTSLAKAYMKAYPSSEALISARAVQELKVFFGAGRKLCDGGSLTIIASVSDSPNPVDQAILQELLSVCNCEIYLSKDLSAKAVFPAIDVINTSTRKTDQMLTEQEISSTAKLYGQLLESSSATQLLIKKLTETDSNKQLLENLND